MEGYIKCGSIGSPVENLYVSLKGFKIYLYRERNATQYFDAVLLKGFRVSAGRTATEFDVANPMTGVGYHFDASSADERQRWMDAIMSVLSIISKIPDRPAAAGAAVAGGQISIPRDAPAGPASPGSSSSSMAVPPEAVGSGVFSPQLNTLVLRDYDHFFSFECPEHWETTVEMADDVQETHDACIVTMKDEREIPAFFFVDAMVQDASDPQDDFPRSVEALVEICNSIVDEEGGSVAKTAPRHEQVGGVQFTRVEYTVSELPDEDEQKKLQFCFWCGFREGRAYRIGYKADSEAYEAHLREAEAILSSFAFINDPRAWSKPDASTMETVSKYHLSGSVRYINRNQGFTLMAPTNFGTSTWRTSFVAPLLVSFHVIVPDTVDPDDRLVIANVQVLREDIGEAEDAQSPLSDPDAYAQTSRDGILALGNDKIQAEGHDIERCRVGPYDARKFLTVLQYSNEKGEVTRAQYLLTFTLIRGGSAWIIQFSSTEKEAMDDYLPVVANFVLPSFHLL